MEGYGEYISIFALVSITSALARFGIGDYIMMMVPKLKIKNTDIGNKIIALSINNTLAGVVIIYVSVFGLYFFFQESEALSGGSTSLNIAVFLWVTAWTIQLLLARYCGPWSLCAGSAVWAVLSRILAISAIIVFVLLGSDLIVVDIIALQVQLFL